MFDIHEHLASISGWIYLLCYILAWLVPPVLLTVFFPAALSSSISILGGETAVTNIVAAVLWSILIFGIWILVGDKSSAHQKNFAKYKSIWMGFVITVSILLIANCRTYSDVVRRVEALRGTATLLSFTISNTTNQQASITYWVEKGLCESKALTITLGSVDTFPGADNKKIDRILRNLHGYSLKSKQMANLAAEVAANLVAKIDQLNKKGIESKGTSFKPLEFLTIQLKAIIDQMDATFAGLKAAKNAAAEPAVGADPREEMDKLKIKAVELTAFFYQAVALIASAKTTLDAGRVDILAPFLMVTALYTVFLLLPWALLFLFLLRKREYLAMEKANLLTRLELDEEFLLRAESNMDDIKSLGATDRKKKIAESVGDQAFRNIEYLVSMIFFTAITAAIWHFFFYPHATSGLADLISQGGSIKAFGRYLSSDASPITFGFLGAYFFVIQMLMRRYFASDLNPKAYINAVVRLLVVFILSLFFLIMPVETETLNWAVIAAFVVGIFPRVGLLWILQTANKIVQTLKAPGYIDRHLLTELDGLNTWHEARLIEEKVENVQNLATTPLADLIIHTNFSPLQLVDWVDQGLLYIHTREQWTDAFRAVGVRTSTDLLANTCKKDEFDSDKASIMATAVNTSQTIGAPAPESPQEEVRLAAAKLYKATADVVEEAKEAQDISQTLVGDKPETLDAVVALQEAINGITESVNKFISENIKETAQASAKLPAGADDLITKSKDAGGEVEKSATALSAEVDAVKQAAGRLDRKQPVTLAELSEVKERLDAVCAAAANLKAQVGAAVKIADQGAASATAQTEFTALASALGAARTSADQVMKATQDTRDIAALLDKDKPETMNMVTALQTRLKALSEDAGRIQTQVKDCQTAVKGIHVSQPLVNEAHKGLDATAEAVGKLVAAVKDAKDAAAPLEIDSPATMAGLPEVKESVTEAVKTAEAVKSRGQIAAGTLQTASAPPQMSKELLQIMVNSIREGPNIKELACFWKKQHG